MAIVTRPCYATREAVAEATSVTATARLYREIDRAVVAAADEVDRLCHRTFTPVFGTRQFDWPTRRRSTPWRLWLDDQQLITLTAAAVGGQPLDVADLVLYPASGPPYSHVEVNLSSSASWIGGGTWQQTVTLTGWWGYRDDHTGAGNLAAAAPTDATEIAVSDPVAVGVGDLIRVDDERMLVVDRRVTTTGQTLGAALAAQAGSKLVQVDNPALFTPGETIYVDGERMRVDDITSSGLVVERARDGTIAAHSVGAEVQSARTLLVARGWAGTTPAAHTSGAAVSRHVPPPLAARYTQAAAEVTVAQQQAAWARTVGSGESERQASGAGLRELRSQLCQQLGRQARHRAV